MNIQAAGPDDRTAIEGLLSTVWDHDPGAVAYHLRWPPDLGLLAEEAGEVVGYAAAKRGRLHPTFTSVAVHVRPGARGRGLGGALWSALTGCVAGPLKTATYADDLITVAFLKRRQLRVRVETYLDTLDLADVSGQLIETPGLRLLPFSEVAGDPAARLAVARLHDRLYADTHQHDPPVPASDGEALAAYLGDDLVPGWLWLAERDGQFVGVSSLRADEAQAQAGLGWFGTVGLPEAEARQVTLALTLRAIRAAHEAGVLTVQDELDSVNPLAMWLREILPFRPGRVWLTLTSQH